MGKVFADSCYSPSLYIRWQGGRVAKQACVKESDPMRALSLCTPRFSSESPFPNLIPIKQDYLQATDSTISSKRKRSATHSGPASCSSALPQDVQQSMTELVIKAMEHHSFKLPEEDAITPPHVFTIKDMGGSLLLAGRFFCKVSGAYHSNSQSFFMLLKDGRMFQKCHKDGCSGRFECGKQKLPTLLATRLGRS